MWLTDQFIDRPFKVAIFGAVIILLFTAIAVWAETYMPSPITVRDLLDYSDTRTLTFDTKRAAEGYIQANRFESGQIDLQSVIDQNWQLVVGVETIEEGKDTVLTPTGLSFMAEIDEIISNDKVWKSTCLLDGPNNRTCMDNPAPGYYTSKASPLVIFRDLFGEKLQDMTQFGIDFVLFGLTTDSEFFQHALPIFS